MAYEIGSQVGDYQILSILGTGGMGKVYKVRNVISDRVEAMKILLPDLSSQQALADRFLREIKVLASLNHPNIAALHTALRVENQLLMIMELVEGVTLGDKLQAGPIPLKEGLNYAEQALAALGYAHRQGVVHRDIKPANMMLTPEDVLKLMDFGIARAPSDSKLTMTGTTLGSLHYMSPEQVKGGPLDARSDLYSLGVVLYEMVTGKRPFQESSEYSVMAAHLEKAPQPPIEINPNLPQPLNAVILVALAKDPARRFQSADAFRTALASAAGAALPGAPPAPRSRPAQSGPGRATSLGAAPVAPQSPMPLSSATVPIPPPTKSGSYRGLYMALGALLVVIVIAASAIELPRWMKTRAGGQPSKSASTQSSAASSSVTSTPAANASTPAGSPSTAPAATPLASSSAGATQPAASTTASSSSAPFSQETASTKLARKRSQSSAPKSQAAAGAPPTTAAASPQVTTPTLPTASSVQASSNQQSGPDLQALQDRMDKLSSRASVVDQSLKTLQQQQASSGLNLRGDVSASWIRMKGYMDRADAAIAAHDGASAKRSMDQAEREVDFLEKFLGR